ncbi:hypothetical protein CTI12_AA026050 [Artemisia annua]|uniref:Bifunctional inhibitor/plant lipid transfer protein/seed storage helical domain-containing protein n=1 Tax=Artemisia annua TaxID=35608 RepID=A0A2U1QIH5_ARTAN|nr:hypothetical protein CTI12_AA026050 [Artemisia annua]
MAKFVICMLLVITFVSTPIVRGQAIGCKDIVIYSDKDNLDAFYCRLGNVAKCCDFFKSLKVPADPQDFICTCRTLRAYGFPGTILKRCEISQTQPKVELTRTPPTSSPIHSPPRQRTRRFTKSFEEFIGGQATFGIEQSSRQEMSWKNVDPNSPSPITLDSAIPEIPNNLSSSYSPDYNVSTHDLMWTRLYQQASILDAHTEQLKDLQPTRFEWYDRNLDTLFKRSEDERRIMFDLKINVGEIKDKSNKEIGNLDARFRYAKREHDHTHGRVEDIKRTLWMARDAARTEGQRISALETMLANQMKMCQEHFSNLEAAQLEFKKEVRYLRQRRN